MDEVILDSKIYHVSYLHKFITNGGAIRVGQFGIRIAHNPKNPADPKIEIQLFAVPKYVQYKNSVNPTLTKTKYITKPKEEQEELTASETGEDVL